MPRRPLFQRILAIKLADLGDALCITPALRALRQSFPDAQLDVLTTARGAAALKPEGPGPVSPLVDEVLVFEKMAYDRPREALRPANLLAALRYLRQLRSRHYDTVVFFHHFTLQFGAFKHAALALATGAEVRAGLENGRGWFLTRRATDRGFGMRHEVEYWLDVVGAIGAATDDLKLEPPISNADQAYADQLLGQFTASLGALRRDAPAARPPLVAIHPGSGGYSQARRWETAGFAEVANQLVRKHNARIVLVGTAGDGVTDVLALLRGGALNLEGKTTPGQLAAVLRGCDLFIGADSGVVHLAAAAGTPVVAIYGPSNHQAWGPWQPGGRTAVVRSGPLCSPCMYVDHELGSLSGQSARTCMHMVTPAQVLRAAQEVLGVAEPLGAITEPLIDLPPGTTQRMRPGPPLAVLGVDVDPVSCEQAVDMVAVFIAAGFPRQIVTVNPEFVMAARRDTVFRLILNRAALRVPDGQGILWAARHLGQPLPERVAGVDLLERIAERGARTGWRLFLLGAAPGVAAEAAAVLAARYRGINIAGTYAGSPDEREEEHIAALVRESRANVLFVAYGAPAQDKWIARNLPRLGTAVCMGVGGAFDFITGRATRAPEVWRSRGLEWLWRLRHEPWRWKRMLALPRFALEVLLEG